ALSTCISDWFGDERLAWAGTTGELATSLQQPEAELMEILGSSSDELRDLGIQLDLVESYGHSNSVRLRALESRKKRKAKTAASGSHARVAVHSCSWPRTCNRVRTAEPTRALRAYGYPAHCRRTTRSCNKGCSNEGDRQWRG